MEEIAAANGLLELNRGLVSPGDELADEFLDEFQLDAAADCKRALRLCSNATHFPSEQARVHPAPPVMIPVSDSSLQAVVASSVHSSSNNKNDDYDHHQMTAKLLSPGGSFLLDGTGHYLHQQQPVLASIDDLIDDKSALQPPEPCFLLPVLMMDETATAAAAAAAQQTAAGFFAFPEVQKVFAATAGNVEGAPPQGCDGNLIGTRNSFPLPAPDMFQAVPATPAPLAFAAGAPVADAVGVSFPLPLCCDYCHDSTEEMLAASFCDAMVADECWTSLMDEEGPREQQQVQPSSVWDNVQYALGSGADGDPNQATLLWMLQQQQEQRQHEEQMNKILHAAVLPPANAAEGMIHLQPVQCCPAIKQAEAAVLSRSADDQLVERSPMQQQEDENSRRLQDFQTAYESALRNNQVIDVDDDEDDQSDSSSDSEDALPILPDLREHREDTDASSWIRHDPVFVLASCPTGIKLSDKELVKALRNKRSSCVACPADMSIVEADVYADHPARLLNQHGAWMRYFFSKAKYCNFARPTRSRLTIEGCRWKQQGPSLPIRVDGNLVAYKTYLSFVSLKNSTDDNASNRGDFLHSMQKNRFKRSRKCSRYTMEEIVLREDKDMELAMLNTGRKPPPFHVLCRISQKIGQSKDSSSSIPSAIPIPSAVLQRRCAPRDEVTIAFSDRSSLTFELSPIEELLQSMAAAEDMPCSGGELCL